MIHIWKLYVKNVCSTILLKILQGFMQEFLVNTVELFPHYQFEKNLQLFEKKIYNLWKSHKNLEKVPKFLKKYNHFWKSFPILWKNFPVFLNKSPIFFLKSPIFKKNHLKKKVHNYGYSVSNLACIKPWNNVRGIAIKEKNLNWSDVCTPSNCWKYVLFFGRPFCFLLSK